MAERLVPLNVGVPLPRVREIAVVSITDDRDGFRVVLDDTAGREIWIRFGRPFAYRNIDEGDRLRTLSALNPSGDDVLCEVEDSEWLRWFHEESYDVRRSNNPRHFAVLTPDDWIDVLAVSPPEVEIIGSPARQPRGTV